MKSWTVALVVLTVLAMNQIRLLSEPKELSLSTVFENWIVSHGRTYTSSVIHNSNIVKVLPIYGLSPKPSADRRAQRTIQIR